MAQIEYILFDLGSTLLYFDGDWPEVFLRAQESLLAQLHATGLALDGTAFLADYRDRIEAYYTERESEFVEHTTAYILGETLAAAGHLDISEAVVRQALQALYAVSQAHWQPDPDTIPTLQILCEQGYRLGIISNAGDDTDVQVLVDKAQIRPYCDFIISSAAVGIRKPNPRIFQMGLDHWGVRPQQAAMIGDTLGADILGAQNAQIYSIWLTRWADTPANNAHADTIQPDATIQTLAELPQLLQSLHI
jgi:HAD superfamily hydrolase (TIGR01549 family)